MLYLASKSSLSRLDKAILLGTGVFIFLQVGYAYVENQRRLNE